MEDYQSRNEDEVCVYCGEMFNQCCDCYFVDEVEEELVREI